MLSGGRCYRDVILRLDGAVMQHKHDRIQRPQIDIAFRSSHYFPVPRSPRFYPHSTFFISSSPLHTLPALPISVALPPLFLSISPEISLSLSVSHSLSSTSHVFSQFFSGGSPVWLIVLSLGKSDRRSSTKL